MLKVWVVHSGQSPTDMNDQSLTLDINMIKPILV